MHYGIAKKVISNRTLHWWSYEMSKWEKIATNQKQNTLELKLLRNIIASKFEALQQNEYLSYNLHKY